MKISKRAQYGLRAMVYLAKKYKEITPLKEIAKKEKISPDFLEKIISDLEKVKLVKAKRGAFGGYYLAKAPSKISAGEIVRVLEDIVPVSCAGCQMARICSAKSIWKDVQDSVDSALDSTNLSDLL